MRHLAGALFIKQKHKIVGEEHRLSKTIFARYLGWGGLLLRLEGGGVFTVSVFSGSGRAATEDATLRTGNVREPL